VKTVWKKVFVPKNIELYRTFRPKTQQSVLI
jgi:hypothetical protein